MPRIQSSILFCIALILGSTSLIAQFPADVNGEGKDLSDFAFRDARGGDGRYRIADYRGRPLLLVYWDRQGAAGAAAAQTAVRMHREYGAKGLACIFVEMKSWESENYALSARAYLLRQLGHVPGAVVAKDKKLNFILKPQQSGFARYMALVGVDGIVVAAGPAGTARGKIGKGLKTEMKRMKKGWGKGTTRKVRALAFGRNKLFDAVTLAKSEPGQADDALIDINRHYKGRTLAIRYLLDQARWTDAEKRITALSRAIGDHEAWKKEVAGLEERLLVEALPVEREAESKLNSVLKSLKKGKLGTVSRKKLKKIAGRRDAAKTADRARRLETMLASLDN